MDLAVPMSSTQVAERIRSTAAMARICGTGADVSFWNSMTQGADAVSDFSHAEGDKINLEATIVGVPVRWALSAELNFISGTGANGRQAITFLSNGGGGITASDIVFVWDRGLFKRSQSQAWISTPK
jgi:hypothetical protein